MSWRAEGWRDFPVVVRSLFLCLAAALFLPSSALAAGGHSCDLQGCDGVTPVIVDHVTVGIHSEGRPVAFCCLTPPRTATGPITVGGLGHDGRLKAIHRHVSVRFPVTASEPTDLPWRAAVHQTDYSATYLRTARLRL